MSSSSCKKGGGGGDAMTAKSGGSVKSFKTGKSGKTANQVENDRPAGCYTLSLVTASIITTDYAGNTYSVTSKGEVKVVSVAEAALKQHHPVVKPMKIAERRAGCIDAVPDAEPGISKVDKLAGFHLCTGFSGHGFGLGPGAGKLMAEIVTGETTCVDASPFRYTRFFDGTNPRPTTGL